MARKPSKPQPDTANLSDQDKQLAIRKLNQILTKLQEFDTNTITSRSDPKIEVMQQRIDTVLTDIFGSNTVEYLRYCNIQYLDTASINLYEETPLEEIRQSVSNGIKTAIETFTAIMDDFKQDIHVTEETQPLKVIQAYSNLPLHHRIGQPADSLYKTGHYAQAVQEAAKNLVLYVKEKSGINHLDGSSLMQHVFSVNNPILKFNLLATQSDKDEQQGYMHLFTGAALGIRNPRAHENIIDEPEQALEFIAFISLLAKLVDKASK